MTSTRWAIRVRRQAVFEIRILAQIATGAGATSVALSLLGLYAILACSVSQPRREIGIRMAVGATNRRISAAEGSTAARQGR